MPRGNRSKIFLSSFLVVSLYQDSPRIPLRRPPTAMDEFAAALRTVNSGRTPSISPQAANLEYQYNLKEIMNDNDDTDARFKFLDQYLAQLTPRVVRNVYSGYGGDKHILTPEDKLNMMMDYRDVLEHETPVLQDVFGRLLPP